MKYVLIIVLLYCTNFCSAQQEINIPATNGLEIDGTLYESKKPIKKIMLLCHQARFSKGEYINTAPKLVAMGYTCLAISQRSGDSINGIINKTAKDAAAKNLPTNYIDAEPDIINALDFMYNKYKQPIILVGSSYSSSLILKVAAQYPQKVKATISYSPGEYFDDTLMITNCIKQLKLPIYITCSNEEIKETQALLPNKRSKNSTFFKPTQVGKHGSKALWDNYAGNEEYWKSLKLFLHKIK
jgi:dienelactone hydrolase